MTIEATSKRKITFDLAYARLGSADKQLDKTIEEMAELTQAIMKARASGVTYSFNLLEEMGHVELCFEMIKSHLATLPSIDEKSNLFMQFENTREKRLDDWYCYEMDWIEGREEALARGEL